MPKKEPKNYLMIQTNKLILLGCPCSTLENGSCKTTCHKINSEKDPCVDCPISSMVYIAMTIKKSLSDNNMILKNMEVPIVLSTSLFPGKKF